MTPQPEPLHDQPPRGRHESTRRVSRRHVTKLLRLVVRCGFDGSAAASASGRPGKCIKTTQRARGRSATLKPLAEESRCGNDLVADLVNGRKDQAVRAGAPPKVSGRLFLRRRVVVGNSRFRAGDAGPVVAGGAQAPVVPGQEAARLGTAVPFTAGAGEARVPHSITTASASIASRTAP
jgi:hypothetical protein